MVTLSLLGHLPTPSVRHPSCIPRVKTLPQMYSVRRRFPVVVQDRRLSRFVQFLLRVRECPFQVPVTSDDRRGPTVQETLQQCIWFRSLHTNSFYWNWQVQVLLLPFEATNLDPGLCTLHRRMDDRLCLCLDELVPSTRYPTRPWSHPLPPRFLLS